MCFWVDLSHCDTCWTCLRQSCGYVVVSVAIQLNASEECLSLGTSTLLEAWLYSFLRGFKVVCVSLSLGLVSQVLN